jgi:hypothetical protein
MSENGTSTKQNSDVEELSVQQRIEEVAALVVSSISPSKLGSKMTLRLGGPRLVIVT